MPDRAHVRCPLADRALRPFGPSCPICERASDWGPILYIVHGSIVSMGCLFGRTPYPEVIIEIITSYEVIISEKNLAAKQKKSHTDVTRGVYDSRCNVLPSLPKCTQQTCPRCTCTGIGTLCLWCA